MLKNLNHYKKIIFGATFFILLTVPVYVILGSEASKQRAKWEDYGRNYKNSAFLYSYETEAGKLFFASDKEMQQTNISEGKGKLSLLSTSSFFDPAVCAKMPALIRENYFFFRGFTYGSKDNSGDIIFRFSLATNDLSAILFEEELIGDIYDEAGSLFFFTLEDGKLYKNLFLSNFELIQRIPVKGLGSVDKERITFIGNEPYIRKINMEKGGKYEYYKYSLNDNKFYPQSNIQRGRSVSSVGEMLVVPIQSTVYTANYRKKLNDSLTEVRDQEEKLIFSYKGEANLYFITIK